MLRFMIMIGRKYTCVAMLMCFTLLLYLTTNNNDIQGFKQVSNSTTCL